MKFDVYKNSLFKNKLIPTLPTTFSTNSQSSFMYSNQAFSITNNATLTSLFSENELPKDLKYDKIFKAENLLGNSNEGDNWLVAQMPKSSEKAPYFLIMRCSDWDGKYKPQTLGCNASENTSIKAYVQEGDQIQKVYAYQSVVYILSRNSNSGRIVLWSNKVYTTPTKTSSQ